MRIVSSTAKASGRGSWGRSGRVLCALALCSAAQLTPFGAARAERARATRTRPHAIGGLSASAALERCSTGAGAGERSGTFAGAMIAIASSARMSIRIDILERLPGETAFHELPGLGLGRWRASDAGVRTYRYTKTVTGLAAPALYRGTVRFRWLTAGGRVIRSLERPTPACEEPPAPGAQRPLAVG